MEDFFLYRKPETICLSPTEEETKRLKLPRELFIAAYQKEIEDELAAMGHQLRLASLEDINDIIRFIGEQIRENKKYWVNSYDLYRFIENGNGVLITRDSKITGCVFEFGYDTRYRTSYSVRLVVARDIRNHNIGKLLSLYGIMLGMKRGSLVKRGIVNMDNLNQLHLQLDRLGWICEDFVHDMAGFSPSFKICCPLTPEGLLLNRTDQEKMARYVLDMKPGVDYLLINPKDAESIRKVYTRTPFKVVGILLPGELSLRSGLFALPAEVLAFSTKPKQS